MRIHIDAMGPSVAPELRGWLANRLNALNTPAAEILEARVTCRVQQPPALPPVQMQVDCLLAGQTLRVVQTGATLTETAQAVLHALTQQLRAVRLAQQGSQRRGRRRGHGSGRPC